MLRSLSGAEWSIGCIEVLLYLEVSGCEINIWRNGCKLNCSSLVLVLNPPVWWCASMRLVKTRFWCIFGGVMRSSAPRSSRLLTTRQRAAQTRRRGIIVCLRVSFDLAICRRKWHFSPRNAAAARLACHVGSRLVSLCLNHRARHLSPTFFGIRFSGQFLLTTPQLIKHPFRLLLFIITINVFNEPQE